MYFCLVADPEKNYLVGGSVVAWWPRCTVDVGIWAVLVLSCGNLLGGGCTGARGSAYTGHQKTILIVQNALSVLFTHALNNELHDSMGEPENRGCCPPFSHRSSLIYLDATRQYARTLHRARGPIRLLLAAARVRSWVLSETHAEVCTKGIGTSAHGKFQSHLLKCSTRSLT